MVLVRMDGGRFRVHTEACRTIEGKAALRTLIPDPDKRGLYVSTPPVVLGAALHHHADDLIACKVCKPLSLDAGSTVSEVPNAQEGER